MRTLTPPSPFHCSHITRTTQWEDPRKQLLAQQNLVVHQSADSLLRSPQQAQPQQPTLAQQQGENDMRMNDAPVQ